MSKNCNGLNIQEGQLGRHSFWGPRSLRNRLPYSADEFFEEFKSNWPKDSESPAKRRRRLSGLLESHATVAAALLQLGDGDSACRLLGNSEDLTFRTYLIHRFPELIDEPRLLVDQLDEQDDLFVRRALVLSLGGYKEGDKDGFNVSPAATERIRELYADEKDAGVRAAAEWTLREWKVLLPTGPKTDGFEQETGPQNWYEDSAGNTMVVFNYGNRKLAIASKEVTIAQFRLFREATGVADAPDRGSSSTDPRNEQLPRTRVSWYEAAQYCNWLTRRELGVTEAAGQLCYLPNAAGKFADGVQIDADFLTRTGYRLPTSDEWQFACDAVMATAAGKAPDVSTPYFFGQSEILLDNYAIYSKDGWDLGEVGSKKPNDFGLFDVHGNVWEWCQTPYETRQDLGGEVIHDDTTRVRRGGSFQDVAASLRTRRDEADKAGHSRSNRDC